MPAPSSDEQVKFLLQLQTLLAQGGFVATYKFALLLALADISIEQGDDSGGAMPVPVEAIAEKFVRYYWPQAAPFGEHDAGTSSVLKQNTDRQAAVIHAIEEVRAKHDGSLARARADRRAWRSLIGKVKRTIKEQPLSKLQTIGGRQLDFLYANPEKSADAIELKPGVAFCLRRYHEMIQDLVRGAWVRFVRGLKDNQPLLGGAVDLDEFMFGTRRESLAKARPILSEIQAKRCFYCDGALQGGGEVDHFVPWSLYPVDLGHNFVLAHASCNAAKKERLAAYEHLYRWCGRNIELGRKLGEEFDRKGIVHDLPVSWSVTRWAYGQAEATGMHVWAMGAKIEPLDPAWRGLPGMQL
ncbi:HNH endonuclease [Polyangium aurulentum]|uniref:HNH endonuclease signature motif containing protein n=1 Tax=Polyangium aurulentum TaxID=2567896 RepID=UPI0010AE7DAE|nr:HNH endonuclease [Polyangium aurulentum]UQA62806.1 HNH endonuclease [Polyangium aurulentum]